MRSFLVNKRAFLCSRAKGMLRVGICLVFFTNCWFLEQEALNCFKVVDARDLEATIFATKALELLPSPFITMEAIR
jgi:hypothetical protein